MSLKEKVTALNITAVNSISALAKGDVSLGNAHSSLIEAESISGSFQSTGELIAEKMSVTADRGIDMAYEVLENSCTQQGKEGQYSDRST